MKLNDEFDSEDFGPDSFFFSWLAFGFRRGKEEM